MRIIDIVCNLILPFILITSGISLKKNPPKDINDIVGYRTPKSTMNKETWIYAQQVLAKVWIRLGIILIIATLIITGIGFYNYELFNTICNYYVLIQVGTLFITIIVVENALEKKFSELYKK